MPQGFHPETAETTVSLGPARTPARENGVRLHGDTVAVHQGTRREDDRDSVPDARMG